MQSGHSETKDIINQVLRSVKYNYDNWSYLTNLISSAFSPENRKRNNNFAAIPVKSLYTRRTKTNETAISLILFPPT